MTDTTVSMIEDLEDACVGREYELIDKIGEGSFGEIYMGRSKVNARHVAVKLVSLLSPLGESKERGRTAAARGQGLQAAGRVL